MRAKREAALGTETIVETATAMCPICGIEFQATAEQIAQKESCAKCHPDVMKAQAHLASIK